MRPVLQLPEVPEVRWTRAEPKRLARPELRLEAQVAPQHFMAAAVAAVVRQPLEVRVGRARGVEGAAVEVRQPLEELGVHQFSEELEVQERQRRVEWVRYQVAVVAVGQREAQVPLDTSE